MINNSINRKMVEHLKKKHYFITMISNPVRFMSRWKLYREFEARLKKLGGQLLTVEVQQGDRTFQITDANNPMHLQFRTFHELWIKENALNRGIHHLTRVDPTWEYVTFIDADIYFLREDIIEEIIHQLQRYMVVQPWENCLDLGPSGESIGTHYSFFSQYVKGRPYCYSGPGKYYSAHWHPGYALSLRREAVDFLGGLTGPLIDTAILGAGDNHMCHALIGILDKTMAPHLQSAYIKHLLTWQQRAERYIRRDVGYVNGTIVHSFHGKKVDRRYHSRWKILVDNKYDPDTDLSRDAQGIYQLVDHGDLRSIKLRDDIRHYFNARREDQVYLD